MVCPPSFMFLWSQKPKYKVPWVWGWRTWKKVARRKGLCWARILGKAWAEFGSSCHDDLVSDGLPQTRRNCCWSIYIADLAHTTTNNHLYRFRHLRVEINVLWIRKVSHKEFEVVHRDKFVKASFWTFCWSNLPVYQETGQAFLHTQTRTSGSVDAMIIGGWVLARNRGGIPVR